MIPELRVGSAEETPVRQEFSEEQAAASFKKRLAEEQKQERARAVTDISKARAMPEGGNAHRLWERLDLWLPLVASVLLCMAMGILSYRTGRKNGVAWANAVWNENKSQVASTIPPPGAADGVAQTDKRLAARDAVLGQLRREIALTSAELTKLKNQQTQNELRLESNALDKKQLGEENRKLAGERDDLLRQVAAKEAKLSATQGQLKKLEEERSEYVIHTASLETKVSELTNQLDARARQDLVKDDLLEKDRDIRELIGARDLYITEIYDVVHNGDTRKAAGRVFFTKGKSLIFYAYDLNENPALKDASTFAAWGQKGSDWHQASKLGIFYEDNAAKKRWIVKSNDRKTLQEIDAVFITAEPNGGSERPTGKPLLFAYLKVTPNHP